MLTSVFLSHKAHGTLALVGNAAALTAGVAVLLHGRGMANFDTEWSTASFSLSVCLFSFFFSSPSLRCLVIYGHVRLRFGCRRAAKAKLTGGLFFL
jgi:hypothetical protein